MVDLFDHLLGLRQSPLSLHRVEPVQPEKHVSASQLLVLLDLLDVGALLEALKVLAFDLRAFIVGLFLGRSVVRVLIGGDASDLAHRALSCRCSLIKTFRTLFTKFLGFRLGSCFLLGGLG